jgi:hypothetical protein
MKTYKIRLGDVLEFIFRVTGIKAIVKKFYPNCGCDARQKKLNFEIKRK